MSLEKPLDPEAAAAIARVRRLMLIASATTFIAVGAVFAVIGYRVFHAQGSAPAPLAEVPPLPAGAKILSSAVGEGRIVLTVEVDGAIELRVYDLATLKPLGLTRLTPR
jgi:TRAP-type C4-dicarboxylate transport system permease small subunit